MYENILLRHVNGNGRIRSIKMPISTISSANT